MTRFLLIGALTITVAAACKKEADESDAKTAAVVGAQTATVATGRFVETADAVGVIAARNGHIASLAAPAPTRVSKVYVAFGAHVKAGDPLVEFEQAAFDAAAQGADASLAAAQKESERTQRLADAGVLPRKDAETAAADLGAARLNAVNARRARELSTLRSPIDGVVTRMNAVLGASADPTQVMVEVSDPTAVDALLTLSPVDASRVKVGDHVEIHAGASAAAAAIAEGRIADISAVVDSASRGVPARVAVESGASALRIGQTVFGRVIVAEHAKAIVVPAEALVPTGEGFKVFVVDDKGIAESRPVKIGGRTDSGAWITDGLKVGEKIVTQGAYGVDDSAKVVAPGEAAAAKDDEKAAEAGSQKPEAGGKKPEDTTAKGKKP